MCESRRERIRAAATSRQRTTDQSLKRYAHVGGKVAGVAPGTRTRLTECRQRSTNRARTHSHSRIDRTPLAGKLVQQALALECELALERQRFLSLELRSGWSGTLEHASRLISARSVLGVAVVCASHGNRFDRLPRLASTEYSATVCGDGLASSR